MTATDAIEDVDLLAELRNGAWLNKQEFAPLRYHVPGVIPEGSTLLVGAPKIGKSWFVLGLALGIASGGRALGLTVQQRPVFYLTLEDGHRRMQDRCRTLLVDDPIPDGFDYLTALQPGAVIPTIGSWMERHPDGEPPMVILDTLGKVKPPARNGETAYGLDYRIGSALKRLVDDRPGASLVVNHHDRKADSEDFVDRVSGTNGLAGAADTIIVITRDRNQPAGKLLVTGRDVAEGEYAVMFDGRRGLWTLDGGSLTAAAALAGTQRAGDGLGDTSRKLIDFIAGHPEGVTAEQVRAERGDTDVRNLARLAKAGRIAKLDRGRYGPLHPVSQVSQCPNLPIEKDTSDTTPRIGAPHQKDTSDTSDTWDGSDTWLQELDQYRHDNTE